MGIPENLECLFLSQFSTFHRYLLVEVSGREQFLSFVIILSCVVVGISTLVVVFVYLVRFLRHWSGARIVLLG